MLSVTWSSAVESMWATCWDLVSSGESNDVNSLTPHRSWGDYGVIWLRVKWKRTWRKKKKLSKVVFRFEGDKMSFVALLSLSHARVPQMCLEECGPCACSRWIHTGIGADLVSPGSSALDSAEEPSWALRALLIDLWHPAQLQGWRCQLLHSSEVLLACVSTVQSHLASREKGGKIPSSLSASGSASTSSFLWLPQHFYAQGFFSKVF